jgi:hypothetical protein
MIEWKNDWIAAEVLREFARKCPKLNRAISKRRYLLPKVRTDDYVNQEICDNHFKCLMLDWAIKGIGKHKSSTGVELLNVISALKYDRPILYLERELGVKLMETDLPEDFTTEEVYWPWPSFRVMLPTNLVGAPAFDGQPKGNGDTLASNSNPASRPDVPISVCFSGFT